MPKKITNQSIIDLIDANVKEMEDINAAQELLNKRVEDLSRKSHEFVDAMNVEYGWGNWQNVDAKTYEFIPREEFIKSYYVINNPAIRERVEVDDVELKENVEEVSLEKFKELYPNHEAFKGEENVKENSKESGSL